MGKSFEVTLTRRYLVQNDKIDQKQAVKIALENFDAEKEVMDGEDMCEIEVHEVEPKPNVPKTAAPSKPRLIKK